MVVGEEDERPPPPRRPTPDHLPYAEMVRVALVALAEDGGSTEAAISAHIRSSYADHQLPWGHDKLLPYYLQKLVAAGDIYAPSPGRYLLPREPPRAPASNATGVLGRTLLRRTTAARGVRLPVKIRVKMGALATALPPPPVRRPRTANCRRPRVYPAAHAERTEKPLLAAVEELSQLAVVEEAVEKQGSMAAVGSMTGEEVKKGNGGSSKNMRRKPNNHRRLWFEG